MAENSTQPPHATRFVETTRGILSYAQLAPLLAERVLRVLQDIEDGVFAARPLDESLLLDLHRNICGDLTPDWAGRFRTTEVKVGQHTPPLSHQVPLLVRDYFADLNVRLAGKEMLLLSPKDASCSSIRSLISTDAPRPCYWLKSCAAKNCLPSNLLPPMTPPAEITSLHWKQRTDWTGRR